MAGERKRSALLIAAVGLPAFMVQLDNLVVTTAMPAIRSALDASVSDLQWIADAYTLPFAALLLPAAALGDRFGRRAVFLAGIATFIAASAACALATTAGALMAARAVQGAGGAVVVTLSLMVLVTSVPPGQRGVAIGVLSAFNGLGIAIGPVLGGVVVQSLHWTWIFWLNVPVGLVAMVLAGVLLAESHGPPVRLDPGGMLLLSAAIFALVWGVVQAPIHGWTSGRVLSAIGGGAVLAALFTAWELRARSPMLSVRLFRSSAFSLVNSLAFTFNVGVFGSIFLLAQFFQVVQGHGPLQAGLRTLPCSLAPLIAGPAAGLLVNRWGAVRLILAGQAMVVVACCWMAAVFSTDVAYSVLAGPFLLAGIGLGVSYPPISTLAIDAAPPDAEGMAIGTNSMVRELGVAVGVAVLVSIFASTGAYTRAEFVDGLTPALFTAAAIVSVGLALAAFLPRSRVSVS
ncbi:DHA2 family efflux MFS transporter permease subunit [Actinoplanes sp. NPDC051633]|uniref:DHA2 family efflux MFS transporter permease subunit n=1 Tax=Actinoplanes sp. NPDC051633 TaxID=3155670 RepID=UPI00342850C9